MSSNSIYNNCKNCNVKTKNKKFCSKSCSASYNNKGVRRHGREDNICMNCGNTTRNKKFCSNKCSASYMNKDADPKLSNRLRQAKYRAKGYRKMHPEADAAKIKVIYQNCPSGHEVDHIVPLSLGGWHHEDNLQYLPIKENRKKGNRFIG